MAQECLNKKVRAELNQKGIHKIRCFLVDKPVSPEDEGIIPQCYNCDLHTHKYPYCSNERIPECSRDILFCYLAKWEFSVDILISENKIYLFTCLLVETECRECAYYKKYSNIDIC